MTSTSARWRVLQPDPIISANLSHDLSVSAALAAVLVNRGLGNAHAAGAFLEPRLAGLHDPLQLKDMDLAVARTLQALDGGEPICLYGDYDADGMTSVALLVTFFNAIGVSVQTFVPDRLRDGYGLNVERVREICQGGVRLLIALDCGTHSLEEARLASSLGTDMIVLDHHEPGNELPKVAALVNPRRADCSFACKELASVGLAFYFAGAVRRALVASGRNVPAVDLKDLLDFVAIGTVADMVPLIEDNRVFTVHGLNRINHRPRCGVAALCAVADLDGRTVTAGNIAFHLAPRLNASGRLSDAAHSVDLLLARDAEEAKRLAGELDQENSDRRRIEAEVLEAALSQVKVNGPTHRAVVVAGAGWHPGVVGIVASRLVEAYQRPAIVIAIDEQGVGHGSCRSIPGMDMEAALRQLEGLLTRFGGHPMAAGVTIEASRIDAFRHAFEVLADEVLGEVQLGMSIRIETELLLQDIRPLMSELGRLQPHGMGNPEPVFAFLGLTVGDVRRVGRDQAHLQVRFRDATDSIGGIWFRAGNVDLENGDAVDVAASVICDAPSGNPRLKVRDVRPSQPL